MAMRHIPPHRRLQVVLLLSVAKTRISSVFSSESQIPTTRAETVSSFNHLVEMDRQITFLFPGDHVPRGRQNCMVTARLQETNVSADAFIV